jgi:hypothetical protein
VRSAQQIGKLSEPGNGLFETAASVNILFFKPLAGKENRSPVARYQENYQPLP